MNWFSKNGYAQGVFFSLLFLAIGPFLDAVTKLLGAQIPPIEILFFRFLFSALSILPIVLFKNTTISEKDSGNFDIKLNLLRGILGFLSFLGCIYSVTIFPLSEVTVIFWTMPFFVLILSMLALKEKVSKQRVIATIIGFGGLCFFFSPTFLKVNIYILIPIFTTFLFAVQDVIIKKISLANPARFICEYAVIIALCALPFTFFVWVTPSWAQFALLITLGIGANLMQFCIFKAFKAAEISALAPFRYTEFIFASIFGYIFFSEVPTANTFYAAMLIVPATMYLVLTEKR